MDKESILHLFSKVFNKESKKLKQEIILNINERTNEWNKCALIFTIANEANPFSSNFEIKENTLVLNISDSTNEWNKFALDLAQRNRLKEEFNSSLAASYNVQ